MPRFFTLKPNYCCKHAQIPHHANCPLWTPIIRPNTHHESKILDYSLTLFGHWSLPASGSQSSAAQKNANYYELFLTSGFTVVVVRP